MAEVNFINFPEDRFVKQSTLRSVLDIALTNELPACLGQWDHPKVPYKGSLKRSTTATDPIDEENKLYWAAVDVKPENIKVDVERTAFEKPHLHGAFAGEYDVQVSVKIDSLEVAYGFRRYSFKPTVLDISCSFKIEQFFIPGSRVEPSDVYNVKVKFLHKLKLTKVIQEGDPVSCFVGLIKPCVDAFAAGIVEKKVGKTLEQSINEALQHVNLQHWLTFEQVARFTEAAVGTTMKVIEFGKLLFGKEPERSESDDCVIS